MRQGRTTSNQRAAKARLADAHSRVARKKKTLLRLFPEYRQKEYDSHLQKQTAAALTELKRAHRSTGLALYIGAGVSRSIGLPSWGELLRSLTLTMMGRKIDAASAGHSMDFSQFMSLQHVLTRGDRGNDNAPLIAARSIKRQLGRELASVIAFRLYENLGDGRLLEDLVSDKSVRWSAQRYLPSSPLTDAIVSLCRTRADVAGIQAIVNYNFDDLLEQRLRHDGVRCSTIRSGKDRVPVNTLPSYHVHGTLSVEDYLAEWRSGGHRRSTDLVFGEDDYHREYAAPHRWSNMTQMGMLSRYAGLFIGLSLEDPNIRRLIDLNHRSYPRAVQYAILTRRPTEALSSRREQSILVQNIYDSVTSAAFAEMGLRVVWANDHNEVPTLLQQILGPNRDDT